MALTEMATMILTVHEFTFINFDSSAKPTHLHGMIQQVSTANIAEVLLSFDHGRPRPPPVDTINQLHQGQMRAFKKESAVTLF